MQILLYKTPYRHQLPYYGQKQVIPCFESKIHGLSVSFALQTFLFIQLLDGSNFGVDLFQHVGGQTTD